MATRRETPHRPSLIVELPGIGLGGEGSDVDEVAESPQGLVRPGVSGDQNRVVRGRRREESGHTRTRRHGGFEELLDSRWRAPLRPLRPTVHLDVQRQAGPGEPREMVDSDPEPFRIVQLDKACRDQRALGLVRVGDQECRGRRTGASDSDSGRPAPGL